MGRRIEIVSAEMKKYHRSEPDLVAESAGRLPQGFYSGVYTLGGAVTDPIEKVHKIGRASCRERV